MSELPGGTDLKWRVVIQDKYLLAVGTNIYGKIYEKRARGRQRCDNFNTNQTKNTNEQRGQDKTSCY